MKRFELKCTAKTTITELWTVMANDADEAIDIVMGGRDSEGHDLKFVEQIGVDDEEDRHVEEVTEV
jgi:hypothetical protein